MAITWYEVGDHLGIPVDELDAIQENNSGRRDRVQNCLRDMFIWWLRNGKEKTAERLIKAVHAVGKHDHAAEKEIKQEYRKWNTAMIIKLSYRTACIFIAGIHHVVHQSPLVTEFNLPVNVQRYCDDMKARYLQRSVLPGSDWPPSLGGQYIRLALISQGRLPAHHKYEDVIEQQKDYTRGDYDKILAHKTKIELEAIFDKVICEGGNEIWPLKMLIDGAPGVGKTTLSRKVSHMWAEGEFLKEYWLVLLLHLREMSSAKIVDDFFYHEDSEVQRDVIKFVKERSGDGVLIIFDGFDELSSYERSERSLFLDISEGQVLPRCAVVITSRPYASRCIQELSSINRHIEVLGFTEEQVEMCIRQKLTDKVKAEELCIELKDRLDVASICQIPLNCSIVLYVYEQGDYSLPHTLTELYELFILHSLKRFVKRTHKSRAAVDRLEYLNSLPDPINGHFKSLCYLAYEGLEEDKLVFSRFDVEDALVDKYQDLDMPILDLMASAKSYSRRGAKDTYSFLHLTIQEFLAAYWITHYSTDAKKLYFLKKHLMDNRFRMVLLFFSGLTQLNFPDAQTVFSKESWIRDHVHICHLLYESENHSIYRRVSENCILSQAKSIEISGSRFDTLVVSQFIAYSGCQWDQLELKPKHVKIVHRILSTCKLENTSIKETLIMFSIAFDHPSYGEDVKLIPENYAYFSSSVATPMKVSPKGELKRKTYDVHSTTFDASAVVEVRAYAFRSSVMAVMPNIDFTFLTFIDELTQITRVVVRVMIYAELYKQLIESLGAIFMGPRAVHRKHYTIILDFTSVLPIFFPSYYGYHWTTQFHLFELMNECCTQNSSVSYIVLNPEKIDYAAYTSARLSQEISIFKLAHFRCTVGDGQNPFQEAFPAPKDFLLSLISVHRSLQQLHLDVPGLHDLICANFIPIKFVLINNVTLQKLILCSGLLVFKRNQDTNEMELTTPTANNVPLKLITSLSIIADVYEQKCIDPHLKQSSPANVDCKRPIVVIVIRKVTSKAPFFRILL